MSRILVMGDVVDDIVVRPLSAVTEASDTAAEIRMHCGGSAGNVAAWLGYLGQNTVFLGRAGVDGAARHTAALAEHGVDARIVADPERATGTIVLNLDSIGERTMYVDRAANAAFTEADIGLDALDGVDWLHLTGYSIFAADVRPAALSLIARARDAGAGISVDPSSVGFLKDCRPADFYEWIEGVDLIFPNLLEGQYLTGRSESGEVVADLASTFAHVVLTMGRSGALYGAASGTIVDQAALPATVVDTTGAGDAFAAGFLHAWVENADPVAALRVGAEMAARAISVVGARPPL